MHALSIITTTLLTTASLVAAVDIDFVRFSQDHCPETYHIRKDTNLHDPHCKTFSDNEPPFNSFIVHGDDDMDDLDKKDCYATTYVDKDCEGEAHQFLNMEHYLSQCMSTKPSRSVRITCKDRHDHDHKHKPKPAGTTVVHVDGNTVTQDYVPEYTTMTLYPLDPHHDDDSDWCHYPNGVAKKVKRGTAC